MKRKELSGKRESKITKSCLLCGEGFRAVKRTYKEKEYCSTTCKNKAWAKLWRPKKRDLEALRGDV